MAENGWSGKPVEWIDGNKAYISVPFTWNAQAVWSRCIHLRTESYEVTVGGPGAKLMSHIFAGVATVGDHADALWRHNPRATVTSRGCIRSCEFCAVPKVEGDLRELPSWEPKSIVCDNNLLACSRTHFGKVIDSLKHIPAVDFNQGFDARLLRPHHVNRLAELDLHMVRLAWDHTPDEQTVMDAIAMLRASGIPREKIRVYVLIGFDDTPEDALYRLIKLKEHHIWPNPMRFNPLDTAKRDSYVAPGWTGRELRRFMRYWARQRWLAGIPFDEFEKEHGT